MSDKDFDLIIARILRYGINVVSVLFVIGWASSISFSENIFLNYQSYHAVALSEQIRAVWLGQQWGSILAYLGLAILISLPILRVLMVGILFTRNKEYKMVSITALVALGLILSLWIGRL